MTVTIPKDLEGFIEQKVRAGQFPDASAVVCEAVRQFSEQQRDWNEDSPELKAFLLEAVREIAQRYRLAVQVTLARLLRIPDLGRLRFPDDPELLKMRSCVVLKPFNNQLLFYRVAGDTLIAERTIHGARDLPRRLKKPPQ